MTMEKEPLVILAGPTAVGKTGLSLALAKRCGGEIVSCDSMQVYRHMDIGSAKILPEQMQGEARVHQHHVEHHVGDAIADIRSRGCLPIAVGGTGFYIQALLYDADFSSEQEDRDYRRRLEMQAADGSAAL